MWPFGESHSSLTLAGVLTQYLRGYYPFHDPYLRRFYWERAETRAILPLDATVAARAERLLRRSRPDCTIVEDQQRERVLSRLADPEIHAASWVGGEVRNVYSLLASQGYLNTLEAIRHGQLVGALLGIRLPGVFLAETMFQEPGERNVSKACLCYAVRKYAGLGYAFMDLQMPHEPDHPAARLGEQVIPLEEYLDRLHGTLRRNGFPVHQWLSGRRTSLSLSSRLFSGTST